jgi:hypothetical protein
VTDRCVSRWCPGRRHDGGDGVGHRDHRRGPGPAVPQLDLTVGEGLADDEDARDADELGVLERHAR